MSRPSSDLYSWVLWVHDKWGSDKETKLIWRSKDWVTPEDNVVRREQSIIRYKKGVYHFPATPGWKPVYHILEQMCPHDWQR